MLRCRQRQCRRRGRLRTICTLHLCTSLIAFALLGCLLRWAHAMSIRAPAGLESVGRVEVGLADGAWRRSSTLLTLCTSLRTSPSHGDPLLVGLGLGQIFVGKCVHGYRSSVRSRRARSRTRKRRERIVVAAPLVGAAARACGACRCRACRARIRACRCSTTEGTHDAGMIRTSLTRFVGTATDGAR